MSGTVAFASTSPRFGLPLLFAGQAQKEAFVNEALSLTDALLSCAVEGVSATPPASPAQGTNWIVAPSATGAWAGMDGKIACMQAGNWIFVAPINGMSVYNKGTGQIAFFNTAWTYPAAVTAPTGGTTVDTQARTAIVNLIAALKAAWILPPG